MNSMHWSRKKLVFGIGLFGILLTSLQLSAQLRDNLNLPESDSKPFYLGIGIIYSSSHFQISAHPKFLQGDTILSVNSPNNSGVGLTGFFNFRLSNHFQFRVVFPELIFSSQTLAYTVKSADPSRPTSVNKQ